MRYNINKEVRRTVLELFEDLELELGVKKRELFIDNFDLTSTRKEFYSLLLNISDTLEIDIIFSECEEVNEYLYGLPLSYEWEEIANDKYKVYVTPFGLENMNISLCEIVLFMFDVLIKNYTSIIEEDENTYRSVLVLTAVYFGFGFLFLKRIWVTGSYNFLNFDESIKVKYVCPLDLDVLIFSMLIVSLENEYFNKLLLATNSINSDFTKKLRKFHRKELKRS